MRRPAALRNGPNNERLSPARIAGRENAGLAGHVPLVCFDVASAVESQAELFNQARPHRPQETEGQQNEIRLQLELAARNRFERRRRTDANSMEQFYIAFGITREMSCRSTPLSNPSL